jgi:Tol biopolymer transport system component
LIGSDGRGDRRIRNQPAESAAPRWSPDGRRIAFFALNGKGFSLFVIKPDGSGLRRLFKGTARDSAGYLGWSPNGRSIAFLRGKACSSMGFCDAHISILSLANGKISNVPHTNGAVFTPSWSPNGKTIAFSLLSPRGLWLVKANGKGLRRLSKGFDAFPDWEPNGKSIAFTREGSEIQFITLDGTYSYFDDPIGEYAGATWSPDGRKLTFSLNKGENGDICTMSASTGKTHCLTHTPKIDDQLPDWQP